MRACSSFSAGILAVLFGIQIAQMQETVKPRGIGHRCPRRTCRPQRFLETGGVKDGKTSIFRPEAVCSLDCISSWTAAIFAISLRAGRRPTAGAEHEQERDCENGG